MEKDNLNKLDLTLLKRPPTLELEVILEIQPLAPLSMVSELPGSYYKSLKSPSKKMLCGLFENVLGWHIDTADRKEIIKEIKKLRKKQKVDFTEHNSGSSYSPLLIDYFDLELEMFSAPVHYNDYWSKAFRRADAIVHPKGTFNLSYELIPNKRELPRNDKKPRQVEDKSLEVFFKGNIKSYPLYYSSPTGREYIITDESYQFKLIIDSQLFIMLEQNLAKFNIAYLGNSEGWIDMKIKTL